jgi:arylsulfatase
LEVAGVNYPEQVKNHPITPMRGASLLPAFKGEEIRRTQPFFWEYVGEKALRKGDWKLVKTKTSNWELYNLKDDPTELTDMSTKRPETLKELVDAYSQWASQVGVKEVKQKQGGE